MSSTATLLPPVTMKAAIREVALLRRRIPRDSGQNQYRALPANNHVLLRLHVLVRLHGPALNLNHNHSNSNVHPRPHLRAVPCSPLPTRWTTFLQMVGFQKLMLLSSSACHLHMSFSARVVRPPPFVQVLTHLCAPYPKILYLWYQSLDLLARRYILSLLQTLVTNERYVGELRVRKV